MKFFVFITLVVALVACGPETEPPASALNPAVLEPVTRPAEGPSPVEILPPIEARDGPLAVLGTASGLLLFDVDAAAPQPALRLRRIDSRSEEPDPVRVVATFDEPIVALTAVRDDPLRRVWVAVLTRRSSSLRLWALSLEASEVAFTAAPFGRAPASPVLLDETNLGPAALTGLREPGQVTFATADIDGVVSLVSLPRGGGAAPVLSRFAHHATDGPILARSHDVSALFFLRDGQAFGRRLDELTVHPLPLSGDDLQAAATDDGFELSAVDGRGHLLVLSLDYQLDPRGPATSLAAGRTSGGHAAAAFEGGVLRLFHTVSKTGSDREFLSLSAGPVVRLPELIDLSQPPVSLSLSRTPDGVFGCWHLQETLTCARVFRPEEALR